MKRFPKKMYRPNVVHLYSRRLITNGCFKSFEQSCFLCNQMNLKEWNRYIQITILGFQLFLLGIHHHLLYTCSATRSAIFTVLAQDSKADGGYLVFTNLPIFYGTKELATSSQFHLWMTKLVIH